jgi:hypothetical protein
LDTSPEAPGDGCNPQVLKDYDGQEIRLPSGEVIDLDSTPELASLKGHTLIAAKHIVRLMELWSECEEQS